MERCIPEAIAEDYALGIDELMGMIRKQRGKIQEQENRILKKEKSLVFEKESHREREELRDNMPAWQRVIQNADVYTKRVLVSRVIEWIDVTEGQIFIRFRMKNGG